MKKRKEKGFNDNNIRKLNEEGNRFRFSRMSDHENLLYKINFSYEFNLHI